MQENSSTDLQRSTRTETLESPIFRRDRTRRLSCSQVPVQTEANNEAFIYFLNGWLHRLARINEE